MAKPSGPDKSQRPLPNHADALVAYTNRLLDLLSDDGGARTRDKPAEPPPKDRAPQR